jgi:7-cyano-7-deazaguanine synthase
MVLAKSQGYDVYAISFRYDQRYSKNLYAAEKIAAVLGSAQHLIVDINLSQN